MDGLITTMDILIVRCMFAIKVEKRTVSRVFGGRPLTLIIIHKRGQEVKYTT